MGAAQAAGNTPGAVEEATTLRHVVVELTP